MNDRSAVPPAYFLSDEDVGRAFDWDEAIAALADAYGALTDPAMAPERVLARKGSIWLRSLVAVSPKGRLMGTKLFAMSAGRNVSYVIPLLDQQTAALVCLVDGRPITGTRTAATTCVALDRIAPREIPMMAMIGSGEEARHHIVALSHIRRVGACRVFSPNAEHREAFCRYARENAGIEATPVASSAEALKDATQVIAATRTLDGSPVLFGKDLAPGATIASIGASLPEHVEIDPEVVRRARIIVADGIEEVLEGTGDMIAARKAGVDATEKTVSLADLVQGKVAGRRAPGDIVMYKSTGSGLQDIAVAEMCWNRARRMGLGTELPMQLSSRR
jgi:ornithine cyclodeaminase/alanine dehydrogenase-like protein (mu-crystallin family)